MKYYPVYLNMKGQRAVVIGAGEVAWQKIPALIDCEAQVIVIAPEAVTPIQVSARTGALKWEQRPYKTSDLKQARLVIAATDDPKLQKKVAADARARGIWVNVVDVTPLCDFIAPAIISQGDLQIAISTGGASPALARFLREKLEPLFGPEYGLLIEVLQRWRPEILKLPKPRRQAVWEAIINQNFLDRLKKEGLQTAETRLKELVHG